MVPIFASVAVAVIANGGTDRSPVFPPLHVTVEKKRLAVVGAQRLVHAFAVQKAVVEHRYDGVLLIGDASVYVDSGSHRPESTIRDED